jgi:putative ubiquitin-RnfH superfamily antitoxin RatB of RatAB toxin-antitoxin module
MITQVLAVTLDIGGKPTAVVMSVGKDGFFRLWDMNSCSCLAALSCQVTEAYCIYFEPQRNVVYVGTNKEEIVTIGFGDGNEGENPKAICNIRGTFKKKSFARCAQLFVDHSIMYVFNGDRTIELYKMLTPKEIEARRRRVKSRRKKGEEEQVEEPE